MAVVVGIQPIQVMPIVQQRIEENRVSQATKGAFQTFKEKVAWTWSALKVTLGKAGGKVSFFFFRCLDLIHPSLAPRIESLWLRATGMWDHFWNEWKQNRLREENTGLKNVNRELNAQVQQLAGQVAQLPALRQENEDQRAQIAFLSGERVRLLEDRARLTREIGDVRADLEVVRHDRDLHRQQLAPVIQQNNALQTQVNALLQRQQQFVQPALALPARLRGLTVALQCLPADQNQALAQLLSRNSRREKIEETRV